MRSRCQRRSAAPSDRSGRSGLTLVELLVVLSVIAVMVALLLPAIQAARSSARRANCQSNLAQLCLALHQYHDVHKSLPHSTVDPEWISASGEWSWGSKVLPYLEENAVYEQCNFDLWPAEEENQPILATVLPVFRCPAEAVDRHQPCEVWDGFEWVQARITNDNYGLNEELDLLNDQLQDGWRFASITDGLSNTLMLGETTNFTTTADNGAPWSWHTTWSCIITGREGASHDHDFWTTVDCANIDTPDLQEWNHLCSRHSGGAHGVTCDGSVRLLATDIDPAVLEGLAKPNDGNPTSDP
jgi:prepilin-type N-terminal cleavage/methylation domain-containing protein/prepilin-type processing-associated H-X9-DG protein